MGCCFSSQAHDQTSPYPNSTTAPHSSSAAATIPPDASSRNITSSSPPRPASLNSARASSHDEAHARPPQPTTTTTASSIAPNKPLKPLNPTQRCPLPNTQTSSSRHHHSRHHQQRRPIALSQPADAPWTRKRLEFERTAFWDTRTNSRPEFWQAARLAVELLQQGEVAEAQGILDAVGITCPRGEIWGGLFDERGELLSVPDWVVIEPSGLVEEEEEEEGEKSGDDELAGEDVEKLGLTKGKGKAVVSSLDTESMGPVVRVRCRLSSSGKDYIVRIGKEERVGVLAGRLREYASLPPTQKIRLIYLGRVLNEHHKLSHAGWREGTIVNAFVFDVPQLQQQPI